MMPNCDPHATAGVMVDCLESCQCDAAEADMVNNECVCKEQGMIMTTRGCRPDHHQQECEMRPQASYFDKFDVCRQHMDCPDEMRYDGCEWCVKEDDFENPSEVGCDHCRQGYHVRQWKYGVEMCVKDGDEYNCQADPATGRPQGPEGCNWCYMVGDEAMCQECDYANGWEMDW
jgi:hypothetical protein